MTIHKTINSLTSPGEIYLIGSRNDIEDYYQEIRNMEKTLYQKALSRIPETLTNEFN